MFPQPLHLDRRSAALALLGVMLTLTGCQAIVSSAPEAHVRIIHATPDTPGLDIYQGPNVLAYNLGFGTVTSYIPLSPGTYTIQMTAYEYGGSGGLVSPTYPVTVQVAGAAVAVLAASALLGTLLGRKAAAASRATNPPPTSTVPLEVMAMPLGLTR